MAMTPAAGDSIPANSEIIEVRVAEVRQLFNAIDPSPFRERDLDPRVEEFIVEWSREVPRQTALALLVRVDHAAAPTNEADLVRDAIQRYFGERAKSSRLRLHRLFHTGRISLGIGLAFLTGFTVIGQLATANGDAGVGQVLRESLSIGGWVAMWRPLEVFLYDWWPIRAEARLFDRLASMPVRLSYESGPTRAPAG